MPAFVALPPPDPAVEIVLSTPGMSQGLLQTDGIQVMPRAFVRLGAVQIGGQWRNISSPSASGVAALFLKVRRKIGEDQLEAGASYRIRTGVTGPSDSEAWEFNIAATKTFGKFGLRLIAEYSPKEFADGKSLYVELGPTFALDKATTFAAAVGRRERDGGPDYTSLNAGVSRALSSRFSIDARYYQTTRSALGQRYRARAALSARLAL